MLYCWWELGVLYWVLACKAVWAPWRTHSWLPSAKWLASVRTSQLLPLKIEIKWVSFFAAAVFLYKSTKCPFPEQGNKEGFLYYNPDLLSAITWPKSFLPLSVLFYFPQGCAPTGYSSSIQCHLGVCLFRSSCCCSSQTRGHSRFQQTLFYPHCQTLSS